MVVEPGTSNNPINIPNSLGPPTPTTIQCFQCQSLDHVRPHCPTSAHSVDESPPDTLNVRAQCALAPSVESLVMWAPLAQPQLRRAPHLSLPEWVTWDNLESESQGYDGGNVTVVEDPTSFSPFPSTDCTLYSHFSFDDFVMIAFPDLTRDLDDQI